MIQDKYFLGKCKGKLNGLQHRVLETALLVLGFYLYFGTDRATPVA